MVNVDPENKIVVDVGDAYHFTVCDELAESKTVPVPQLDPLVPTGLVRPAVIVAKTGIISLGQFWPACA